MKQTAREKIIAKAIEIRVPTKDKWGTPDVIGKRESRRSDIVKAPTEIISAEIKHLELF